MPQDQDDIKGAASGRQPDGMDVYTHPDAIKAAMKQAPTPGPLSADDTALVATINYLRADEGDTVSLLCDNPDFNGQPSNAVECNGGWTDWTDKRFTGDSLFAALNNAALAKAVATKTLAPTAPVEASGSERDHRFVPGVMRCAKCNFVVVRRVFSAIDGTVGDGDNKTEPCPNGCGPLWPMTWEQNSRDMEERCEAAVLEAANLRAQLALRPQPSGETRDIASQNEASGVLGWFSALARKEGHHVQADWLDSYIASIRPAPVASGGQHSSGEVTDDLIDRFSAALKAKLRAAGEKYGFDDAWMKNDWRDTLIEDLWKHVQKGDPRDVAAYCAFAWHHQWSVAEPEREG